MNAILLPLVPFGPERFGGLRSGAAWRLFGGSLAVAPRLLLLREITESTTSSFALPLSAGGGPPCALFVAGRFFFFFF